MPQQISQSLFDLDRTHHLGFLSERHLEWRFKKKKKIKWVGGTTKKLLLTYIFQHMPSVQCKTLRKEHICENKLSENIRLKIVTLPSAVFQDVVHCI